MDNKLLDIPIQKPQPSVPVANIPNPNIATNLPVKVDPTTIQPLPQSDNSQSPIDVTTKEEVPSVTQMETLLQQSGKLLNEIGLQVEEHKIDNSPLAALQPDNMLQTPEGPQPISLPSQHGQELAEVKLASSSKPDLKEEINSFKKPALKIAKTVTAIALTIQGLFGGYKAIKFIMVDYPILETQLISHQINQAQVNGFATQAVIIFITTIIGIIFALRILKSNSVKIANIVIGVALFLGSAYINSYLTANFDLVSLLSDPVLTVLMGMKNLINAIIDKIPFLERNSANQLETVWYK